MKERYVGSTAAVGSTAVIGDRRDLRAVRPLGRYKAFRYSPTTSRSDAGPSAVKCPHTRGLCTAHDEARAGRVSAIARE